MSEYQMNDAVIQLPAHFKDKTIHLFTVDEAGSSGFTFVRAPMEPDDTVDTFVTRLISEMRKSLPRFELASGKPRNRRRNRARNRLSVGVGRQPLHQRQTVMSPKGDRERTAISFIGTCPKSFTEDKSKEYKSLLASVVLARPDGGQEQGVQELARERRVGPARPCGFRRPRLPGRGRHLRAARAERDAVRAHRHGRAVQARRHGNV